MNSFTLIGIGNLARNPEVTAKGNIVYVRFCLVGNDRAEPDDEVDHPHEVVTSTWFMAFDGIADDIAPSIHPRSPVPSLSSSRHPPEGTD